ncbi:MAG: 4-hydroxythreonine-4-phosphate dehydrogenase PdxA [Ignavibacteria bacterium]|nr:MAG: 4-hydroxythreonine-4-phosphate dehydrogenase PdxA [Ignavibacteria bacterium]
MKNNRELPVIAISIGDVNGIGPEVTLKSFLRSDLFDMCRPVVYGPGGVVEYYNAQLGLQLDVNLCASENDAREGSINVISVEGSFEASAIGAPSAESGRGSILAIEAAFAAALSGQASAMVTAPISKEAIALAGSPFHGHTDMLASLCKAEHDGLMILSSNTMNVGLVTVHVPLREVADLISREQVLDTIRRGYHAMVQDFGISEPRIAVLGLNPHGGDGGVLGDEDEKHVLPAVEDAQAEGWLVDGPFPADGFFSAHTKQMYDLIIAMYHDQGLVPFKMQAKGRGVNVTAGLPIVRTSPDHGTAYNIASHGLASPESMKEAVHFAHTIALNRLS